MLIWERAIGFQDGRENAREMCYRKNPGRVKARLGEGKGRERRVTQQICGTLLLCNTLEKLMAEREEQEPEQGC